MNIRRSKGEFRQFQNRKWDAQCREIMPVTTVLVLLITSFTTHTKATKYLYSNYYDHPSSRDKRVSINLHDHRLLMACVFDTTAFKISNRRLYHSLQIDTFTTRSILGVLLLPFQSPVSLPKAMVYFQSFCSCNKFMVYTMLSSFLATVILAELQAASLCKCDPVCCLVNAKGIVKTMSNNCACELFGGSVWFEGACKDSSSCYCFTVCDPNCCKIPGGKVVMAGNGCFCGCRNGFVVDRGCDNPLF